MQERTRRIWMTIIGVLICGFSVGMFNFSALGLDPFQVFVHGIFYIMPESAPGFGTVYAVVNLLMLIVIFLADRKKIGLGTLINIFLLGYVADYSSKLFERLLPEPSWPVRFGFLLLGIVIMCFSAALYFTADMGVSTYDAVSLIISEKRKWKFQICRISSDLFCTLVGFCFGATVGIGTVVTAFFMGPLIAFFNRTVAEPIRYGKRPNVRKEEAD
ncbi:MAG: Tat pathway signal sequence [Lachnospiraceae bacterium]|nr:Tat pathway signal sequence [Lachnospiraceae bacterium]